MFSKKQFYIFLLIYFLVRLFSFIWSPPTPLLHGSPVNTVVSVLILLWVLYLLIKGDVKGWIIIAAEMLLCGSGNMFSIGGISLRTALLGVALIVFAYSAVKNRKYFIFNSAAAYTIFALVAWAAVSAMIGLYRGNELSLVTSDLIPYLFLLYFFPLRELWNSEQFKTVCFNLLCAAVCGSAIFMFASFFIFGLGQLQSQGVYYHWFRDVAQGKATLISPYFLRLVVNEHLLLIPSILYFVYRSMRFNERINDLMIICGAAILSLNLTRIYILALAAGLILFFSRKYIRRWLMQCAILLSLIFIFFVGLNMLTSKGTDTGLSYFGLRVMSIAAPTIELSSLSRMILLPQILFEIRLHPVLGNGLGSTVTVYSPVYHERITTSQFDWGYLEIVAETGAIGSFIWLCFIIFILYGLNKITDPNRPLYISFAASILIINITSPALFHVFGAVYIAVILAASRAFEPQPSSPAHIPSPFPISTANDK